MKVKAVILFLYKTGVTRRREVTILGPALNRYYNILDFAARQKSV